MTTRAEMVAVTLMLGWKWIALQDMVIGDKG